MPHRPRPPPPSASSGGDLRVVAKLMIHRGHAKQGDRERARDTAPSRWSAWSKCRAVCAARADPITKQDAGPGMRQGRWAEQAPSGTYARNGMGAPVRDAGCSRRGQQVEHIRIRVLLPVPLGPNHHEQRARSVERPRKHRRHIDGEFGDDPDSVARPVGTELVVVEAPGIEPGSRNAAATASTCVGPPSGLAPPTPTAG